MLNNVLPALVSLSLGVVQATLIVPVALRATKSAGFLASTGVRCAVTSHPYSYTLPLPDLPQMIHDELPVLPLCDCW